VPFGASRGIHSGRGGVLLDCFGTAVPERNETQTRGFGTAVPKQSQLAGEFADVFAWLCTLASLSGVKLEGAVQKYAQGCPKCGGRPCGCGWLPRRRN